MITDQFLFYQRRSDPFPFIGSHEFFSEKVCGYRGGLLLKRDFSIVVDSSLLFPFLLNVDSRGPQLSALLEGGQTPAEQNAQILWFTPQQQ